MGAPREEAVPALPLIRRRRYLGYFLFLVNVPLFIWKTYEVSLSLSAGAQWSSSDLISDLILLGSSFSLTFIFPRWLPVLASRYWLTNKGVRVSRFLKGTITIPYGTIARAEIYVKDQRKGEISKDAMEYAKESASALRKSGFKFHDYTNDDSTIVLLIGEKGIYLLSPMYQKTFVQKLRKRVGRLPIKMVELTPRGQRVKEI